MSVGSFDVNGEKFPSSGKLILGFGTDQFEGPISYYATVENPGSNQILIDPSYRFKHSHTAQVTSVQYIHSNQPFTPSMDGSEFPVYITGTAQARNTMFTLAELLVASGIFIEEDVLLPGLRFEDTAIEPFD